MINKKKENISEGVNSLKKDCVDMLKKSLTKIYHSLIEPSPGICCPDIISGFPYCDVAKVIAIASPIITANDLIDKISIFNKSLHISIVESVKEILKHFPEPYTTTTTVTSQSIHDEDSDYDNSDDSDHFNIRSNDSSESE